MHTIEIIFPQQMNTIFLRSFFTACLLAVAGQALRAQDTILVQTFTYDSISTRRAVFDFPASLQGHTFQKVLALYNLKCDPQTPWDQYDCGEWDYLTYMDVFEHTGQMDSVIMQKARYWINNTHPGTVSYVTNAFYNYYQHYQYFAQHSGGPGTDHTVGSGAANDNSTLGTTAPYTRTQMLFTAAELSGAGISAGNIYKVRLNITALGGAMGHLTLRLKHTASATFTTGFDNGSLTTVYDKNTSFGSTGMQTIDFTQPFTYDGTSNLLVEITYDNQLALGSNYSLQATHTGMDNVIRSNSKPGHLNIQPGEYVELPMNNYHFGDAITVSFWAYGDPAYIPANTSLFEAVDSNNQRILNAHLPWSDGTVYWDAGNSTGYDRIQKAAATSETEGQWNHWAFTKNATTGVMNIYLNGVLWHTGASLNRTIGSAKNFVLGSSYGNSWQYKGMVDEFTVWNQELSQATLSGWMNRKITASHPNYANLVAYYDFDDQRRAYDRSPNSRNGMMSNSGMIEFGNTPDYSGTVSQVRPNLTFVQGTFTLQADSVLAVDSVLADGADIFEYAAANRSFHVVNTIYAYLPGNATTYAPDGSVLGTVMHNADVNLANDSVSGYFPPFEVVNAMEMGRFITPYGIGLSLGANGFTWIYDVSDYVHYLLTDSVDIAAANTQELIDLKFMFITGTPPRDVLGITSLYGQHNSYQYAALDNNQQLSSLTVPTDANADQFKIRTIITGHGHNGSVNCCEWDSKDQYLYVNNQQVDMWDIWQDTDCGDNPVTAQGGTWPYAREGWCPGDVVKHHDIEITPHVTPGQPFTLDYDIEPVPVGDPAQGNGNYVISMQLVEYGAPNFQVDATIKDILNPNSWEYYRKWNPSCSFPRVILQNTGATTITSATIKIWVSGYEGYALTHNWTGSLDFLEQETITIPIPDFSWWHSFQGNLEFHAKVETVNGAADNYNVNDEMISRFAATTNIQGPFFIWFKTNNRANENQIFLKDQSGTVVWSRTSLTNNTEYKDTMSLQPGCYSLELYDSDHDGIGFWASQQFEGETSGFLRIRKVGAGTVKNFSTDFGHYTKFDFTVDDYIGLDEPVMQGEVSLFPNPASGSVNIVTDNIGKGTIHIDILNHLGQLTDQIAFPNNSDDYMQRIIDIRHLASGMYYVRIYTAEQSFTRPLIVTQ